MIFVTLIVVIVVAFISIIRIISIIVNEIWFSFAERNQNNLSYTSYRQLQWEDN